MIFKNLIFLFKIFVFHRFSKLLKKNFNYKNNKDLLNISLYNLKKKNSLEKFKKKKINENYIIELASRKINIKKIKWKKLYSDAEDTDSLYRFNWIIKIIMGTRLPNKKFQLWINNQIHNLIYQTKNNELKTFNKFCFHPYNISERLSNLITYYILFKKNLTVESYNFIISNIQILLNNIEFNGYRTGNHIINNCRALIYSGYFLNNKKITEIGVNIFLKNFKKIFYQDGFLKDGSTHYQFLVTRWIFEINSILKKLNFKNNETKKIHKICEKNIEICNYFNDTSIELFPLFGDISPDFSPKYLNNLFNNKKNSQKNFILIWKKLKFKRLCINKKNNNKVLDIKKISGWLKLKVFKYTLFLKLPASTKNLSHNLIHHSHDDIGHFVIYFKKKIIFSKFGRYSYNNLNGSRNVDHNKIYLLNQKSKTLRLFNYSFLNYNLVFNLKRKKNYFEFSFTNNHFIKWKRRIFLFNSKINIIDKNLSFFNLNLSYHFNNLKKTQIKSDFPTKYKSFLVESYGNKIDQIMFKFLLKAKHSKHISIKL